MIIQPFDPGTKAIDAYTPNELLMGAEAQVRHAFCEYVDDHPIEAITGKVPDHYVSIDCGGGLYEAIDDAYLLVGYKNPGSYHYYFAKSDSEFTLLGGVGERGGLVGHAIALLALKARLGTQAVRA